MRRLIKFFLITIALYLAMRSIIALFFYDELPIAFIASEFSQDLMDEYRARVLIPGFFTTLIYFIFRYLSGKNPTSAIWPLYVSSIALLITHIIGFMTFMPFAQDSILMFIITLVIFLVARTAHHKRKKEIF